MGDSFKRMDADIEDALGRAISDMAERLETDYSAGDDARAKVEYLSLLRHDAVMWMNAVDAIRTEYTQYHRPLRDAAFDMVSKGAASYAAEHASEARPEISENERALIDAELRKCYNSHVFTCEAARGLGKADAPARLEYLKSAINDAETWGGLIESTAAAMRSEPQGTSLTLVANRVLRDAVDARLAAIAEGGEGGAPRGVFVTVPAVIGRDRETGEPIQSVRRFAYIDGEGNQKELASVTLPKGSVVGGKDVSFHEIVVPSYAVDPGGQRYPRTHSIRFPEANRAGEPWNVTLTRDFGHYGPAGWEPDKRAVRCTSAELRDAMRAQYEGYKAYRAAGREKEARPRDEGGIDLDAEASAARAASEPAARGNRPPGREAR